MLATAIRNKGGNDQRSSNAALAVVRVPIEKERKQAMHVQIINFNLKDATEEAYRAICDDLAPVFGAMPGLLSKVWLADAATNTYGGVYLWEDRVAMETYIDSDVFAAVGAHPNLTNITARDFDVLEAPTHVTRGFPEPAMQAAD